MKANYSARCVPLVVAALLAPLAAANAAITEGTAADGRRYVTGGIGSEEVATLQGQAAAYSLQLITAARGGAYLAGAHVRIVGPGNNVVLDTTIDAPWLLIDLPGGRYNVRATHSGKTVERGLTIGSAKAQRVVLHFDVPVDHDGPQLPRPERAQAAPMTPSAPPVQAPSTPPMSAPTMPPPMSAPTAPPPMSAPMAPPPPPPPPSR
jgi:hypothetical protein